MTSIVDSCLFELGPDLTVPLDGLLHPMTWFESTASCTVCCVHWNDLFRSNCQCSGLLCFQVELGPGLTVPDGLLHLQWWLELSLQLAVPFVVSTEMIYSQGSGLLYSGLETTSMISTVLVAWPMVLTNQRHCSLHLERPTQSSCQHSSFVLYWLGLEVIFQSRKWLTLTKVLRLFAQFREGAWQLEAVTTMVVWSTVLDSKHSSKVGKTSVTVYKRQSLTLD